MIIDLILDRKDGETYNAKEFYNSVMQYSEIWPDMCLPIAQALDGGTNSDVQRELCKYIDEQGYNPAIKKWVNSVEWVPTVKKRKTYEQRKEEARQEAIDWQLNDGDYPYSYGGLAIVADYFEKLGRRYGLLREFRENGIPC